jgi:hypothetical protein
LRWQGAIDDAPRIAVRPEQRPRCNAVRPFGCTSVDGLPGFETNRYTSVPGGTLAVTATIDELTVETPIGDGTSWISYTVTYSCDAA